ncbi:MAG: MOSC domain-containing protein [Planctomycetota bacterium]
MPATVVAVSISPSHTFHKEGRERISLIAGHGVEGDAHMGVTVKHRSRVKRDPTQPNLRQVHLIHSELFDELAEKGFEVSAGQLGENITTRGVDLLGLPEGARLQIGSEAVVEITGLRNPCKQLDNFQDGLMKAVLDRDEMDNLVRKSGIMGIVIAGGEVSCGDSIMVELPETPHRALEPV